MAGATIREPSWLLHLFQSSVANDWQLATASAIQSP
jgi:hypothetical protein